MKIEDPERSSRLAFAALELLRRINRIPGMTEDGKIESEVLFAWVIEVRRLCSEYGRAEIGDLYIGQLLSKAPDEEDGSWPCLPVCEVMERITSPEMGRGFRIGKFNSRGVIMRSRREGGAQERELANKYQNLAKRRTLDYPYVGSIIKNLADSYDQIAVHEDDETNVRKRLWN